MESSGISPGAAWCSGILAQWWGWAAPEDTSVLEGTHLGNMLFLPLLYFDRSLIALHVFQEPRTGGLGGGKCIPAVISDAANFCCLLVAWVDHDLTSSNVLDYWLSTQAGKRWEGSLERGLKELWHSICVQHTPKQIKTSKSRDVWSRNEIGATKCQCLHFLGTVHILLLDAVLLHAQHWGSLQNGLFLLGQWEECGFFPEGKSLRCREENW